MGLLAITKRRKNRLPPFSSWTRHANAVVTSPYVLTLNATATTQYSYTTIPVIIGQAYTCTVTGTGDSSYRWNVNRIAANATSVNTFGGNQTATGTVSITFSPDVSPVYLNVYSSAAGTYTFTNPQLELGSAATAFEPKT